MDDMRIAPTMSGGAIEPMTRAEVSKTRSQTPEEPSGWRYELHDPFAEVVYRSGSAKAIIAKADELDAVRFTAIAPDGKRTQVPKGHDGWQRMGPDRADTSDDAASKRVAPSSVRQVDARADVDQPTRASKAESASARLETEAERRVRVAMIEAALQDRYVVKRGAYDVGAVRMGQNEYRFKGDTSKVAFVERSMKLMTEANSPSVARSMVAVAEMRGWQGLRVSGNDEFKRLVWLEASTRDIKAIGYAPTSLDTELLRKAHEARLVNRLEPGLQTSASAPSPAADKVGAKASTRGSGGRKAVLAAVEAVLVAKGVSPKQREAVMAAATENLAKRISAGQTHKVKVFDGKAPVERPSTVHTLRPQRSRDLTPTR